MNDPAVDADGRSLFVIGYRFGQATSVLRNHPKRMRRDPGRSSDRVRGASGPLGQSSGRSDDRPATDRHFRVFAFHPRLSAGHMGENA
jgi:hypothetical protein